MISPTLPPNEQRALTKANEAIAHAEDGVLKAKWALMDEVERLLIAGYSQAEIARHLGIKRATLNQRISAAQIRVRRSRPRTSKRPGRSKASTP